MTTETWPLWDGQPLPRGKALLVRTGPDLASSLMQLGALAEVARPGMPLVLATPAEHALLLGRARGITKVWPQWPSEVTGGAAPPPDLADLIGAQVDLAALPAAPGSGQLTADGPVACPSTPFPRLHLPAAPLKALATDWIERGWQPAQQRLIGWRLRRSPAPLLACCSAPADTLRHAVWCDRDDTSDAAGLIAFGPWPTDAQPSPSGDEDTADTASAWLRCARQLALLDLLLTDDADAHALALALGKPVHWIGDLTSVADLAAPEPADPSSICRTASARGLAATRTATSGELRLLALDDAQQAMTAVIACAHRGEMAAASAGCAQLLISHPNRPDAWRLLGLLAQQSGEAERAGALHRRVTDLAPGFGDGWRSLGLLLQQQGRIDAACDALTRCVALLPQDTSARHHLAQLHRQAGRRDRAIALYRTGLQHRPADLDSHHQLGLLLLEVDQPEPAAAHFNQILGGTDAGEPGHTDALRLLGLALEAQGDADAAAACNRQALQSPTLPERVEVSLALARHYQRRAQHDRAWAVIAPCLADHPDDPRLQIEAAGLRRALCEWPGAPDAATLRSLAATLLLDRDTNASGGADSTPAADRSLSSDALWHLAGHVDAAELAPLLNRLNAPLHETTTGPAAATARAKGDPDRLRVAYAGSATALRTHSALLAALREVHRQSSHVLHVYSWDAPQGSGTESVLQDQDGSLDGVEVLPGASDSQIAACIRADRIDILIDLDGLGPHARPGVWAHHPAGLQLAWLNQPGTALLPGFDARLSDRLSDGATHDADRADSPPATLWLPDCHLGATPLGSLLQSRAQARPTRAEHRVALGLPAPAAVVACMAPHASLDATTWSFWMRLLASCPPAVLWLSPGTATSRLALQQAAVLAGIAPQRLHFLAPSAPRDPTDRLLMLSLADLYLQPPAPQPTVDGSDPLLDALCAGVPALCLVGTHPRGHHSAALLAAAGLPEGISADAIHHEAQAMRLMRHPRELLGWRQKLAASQQQAALFQPDRLARKLEAAWQELWHRRVIPTGHLGGIRIPG